MRKFGFLLILFLIAVLFGSCSSGKEEQFLIKGDDVGYSIFQDFIHDFNLINKDTEFNFVGGGAQSAINAMVDGSCEIVFSLKKLNNEDLALLKSKNIFPVEIPLFTIPILIIANSSVPIDKLTLDEVKKIFSGIYRYWWQLAKNKKDKDSLSVLGPIDLCCLDQRNGANHFLRNKLVIGDFQLETRYFGHSNALVDFVAHNAASIGFLSIPFFNQKVENLKILYSDTELDAVGYLIFDRTLKDNPRVKKFIDNFRDYMRKNNSLFLQKGIKPIE